MPKPAPSVATRVEVESRELLLKAPEVPPQPLPLPRNRASDRIKEALLRWLEKEME